MKGSSHCGSNWSSGKHGMSGWNKAKPTTTRTSRMAAKPMPAGMPATKHIHVFHHKSKG